MATCKGHKKDGTPCQCPVVLGNGYCAVHQSQAKAEAVGAKSKDRREVTLAEFIEENHRLLTVLGVFTAMTVFASNLPLAEFGSTLAFEFIALSILVFVELFAKLVRITQPRTTLLMFSALLTMAATDMVLYWLVAFRSIWHQYLAAALTTLIFVATASGLYWCVRRYNLVSRILRPRPEKVQLYWTVFNIISLVVVASLVFWPAHQAARGLNQALDEFYRKAVQPTPTATITMSTATLTPVPSLAPTVTPTLTATASVTPTPTGTSTATPTPTTAMSGTPTQEK